MEYKSPLADNQYYLQLLEEEGVKCAFTDAICEAMTALDINNGVLAKMTGVKKKKIKKILKGKEFDLMTVIGILSKLGIVAKVRFEPR